MTPNLGTIDRVIRLILGIMLLGLYGALAAPWRYLSLLGILLIATAIMSTCPLYRMLGINSRPSDL